MFISLLIVTTLIILSYLNATKFFMMRIFSLLKILYKSLVVRKKFANLYPTPPHTIREFLKWRLTNKLVRWKVPAAITPTIPVKRVTDNTIKVTFVGHATFLIQTLGFNILTDPIWSLRAGPRSLVGPKRVLAPGINFSNLPPIDLVLVSHNHYDHLDNVTLNQLWKHSKPKLILPAQNQEYVSKHLQPITLQWNQDITWLNWGIKIHLVPAQHWSGRFILDNNYGLWGSYIIENLFTGSCIAFLCDTAYDQRLFKQLAKRFPDIKLSIIPIGAYEPRHLMKESHINPEEAVLIHQNLQSQVSIASHFGTFRLSDESYDQPVQDLEIAKSKLGVEHFLALQVGQEYTLSQF